MGTKTKSVRAYVQRKDGSYVRNPKLHEQPRTRTLTFTRIDDEQPKKRTIKVQILA